VIDRTYGIEEFIANLGIAAHRDGFASKVKMATAGSQTDTKIMHPREFWEPSICRSRFPAFERRLISNPNQRTAIKLSRFRGRRYVPHPVPWVERQKVDVT